MPISVPAPDFDPARDPVRSFPSLGPGYPLGAMRVYRLQASRTELSGARKRYRPRSRSRPAPPLLPSPFSSSAPSFTSTHVVFPFPLRPRPHDHSRPRSHPGPRYHLVPAPDPVRSFPSLGPGYPLGTMRVYRHRALRTELSGARKHHPLSAEMVTRAE